MVIVFLSSFWTKWISFCSKSKGKLSRRWDSIHFERKWKYNCLSVRERLAAYHQWGSFKAAHSFEAPPPGNPFNIAGILSRGSSIWIIMLRGASFSNCHKIQVWNSSLFILPALFIWDYYDSIYELHFKLAIRAETFLDIFQIFFRFNIIVFKITI